eukprot:2297959-Pyramimonas_sp.AAC.1
MNEQVNGIRTTAPLALYFTLSFKRPPPLLPPGRRASDSKHGGLWRAQGAKDGGDAADLEAIEKTAKEVLATNRRCHFKPHLHTT